MGGSLPNQLKMPESTIASLSMETIESFDMWDGRGFIVNNYSLSRVIC